MLSPHVSPLHLPHISPTSRQAEKEMHIKEGVPWKDIEFADNQPAIELLEKPPQGQLVRKYADR